MQGELSVSFRGESLSRAYERIELLEAIGKVAADFGVEFASNNSFDNLVTTPDNPWEHDLRGITKQDFERLQPEHMDYHARGKITGAFSALEKAARRERCLVIADDTVFVPRQFVSEFAFSKRKRGLGMGPQALEIYSAVLLTSCPEKPKTEISP